MSATLRGSVVMTGEQRTIGVVLGGHLGDSVVYSAVLEPLRERFADAEIVLIARTTTLELFAASPYIDRAVSADELVLGPWFRLPIPGRETFARMTRRLWAPVFEVDTLLFPYLSVTRLQSGLLQVVKHREAIGCVGGAYLGVSPKAWDHRLTRPYRVATDHVREHIFDHLAGLLDWLGCSIDIRGAALNPADWVPTAEVPDARPFGGAGYGMIFPGCSFRGDIKIWPLERYSQMVAILGKDAPDNWMICGKPDELARCRRVAETIMKTGRAKEVLVCCDSSVREVAAAVTQATFAVGADNGGLHLAVAMGIPSVTILSGTVGHLYFPWGDARINRVAEEPMDCWYCRYKCVHPRPLCIESISADTVAEICRFVLAASLSRDRPTPDS